MPWEVKTPESKFTFLKTTDTLPDTQDLFARQKDSWKRCPAIVQEQIVAYIRQTITDKVQQVHGVHQDRREGYDDDWDAVCAELETRRSGRTLRQPIRRSLTPANPQFVDRLGHRDGLNESQETDVTGISDFSQTSLGRAVALLDHNGPSLDRSREETVGMSPTLSRRLSLSLPGSQEGQATPSGI